MHSDITIVGNVGRNPELRQTQSGVDVCNFSVAVNRSWTDNSGERQEKTTWFRVVAWRNLATVCSQYLSAGSKVLVNAEDIQAQTWVDREGEAQGQIELTARRVVFLSARDENDAAPVEASSEDDAPTAPAADATEPAQDETDIPF